MFFNGSDMPFAKPHRKLKCHLTGVLGYDERLGNQEALIFEFTSNLSRDIFMTSFALVFCLI